jgi:predicted transcriptional regulator
MVREDLVEYLKKEKVEENEEEDDLTEEQINEFDKAVKEMENGEFVTMDDFKKVMSRWITK